MPLKTRQTSMEATGESPRHPSPAIPMIELLTRQVLERARLAVIYGGDKSTDGAVLRPRGNPRSWKSYEAVARDIANALGRIGAGHVEVIPDDMRLADRLKDSRIDMAWLNTGGVQGHSAISHAPAMLELLGIPYVGHDPLTAAILDNKFVFKRQMHAMGLPTAPFIVWRDGRVDPTASTAFARIFKEWKGAYIVKPISGRASLNVHYVEHTTKIAAATREVIEITNNPVLIEAYLPGREYCIAVSGPIISRGNRLVDLDTPFTFAAIERVLSPDERIFTSMDHKPITHDRIRALDSATDAYEIDTLEELASRLYLEFPLRTLVRLDVRADRNGRLFILEANPKPDLKAAEGKSTSLIGAGLANYGMTYDDLIFAIFANRSAELLGGEESITDTLLQLIGH